MITILVKTACGKQKEIKGFDWLTVCQELSEFMLDEVREFEVGEDGDMKIVNVKISDIERFRK